MTDMLLTEIAILRRFLMLVTYDSAELKQAIERQLQELEHLASMADFQKPDY